MNTKLIIKKLLDKKISIYEAIDEVKKNPNLHLKNLRTYLSDNRAYIRLFAAWSLGELKDQESFDKLIFVYQKEKDDNVKANIVRALYFIDPNLISLDFFRNLLINRYYPIVLMAIKFLPFNCNLHQKIEFESLYKINKNILIKTALLKNVRLFLFIKDRLINFLFEELKKEKNIILKAEIIKSISLLNDPVCLPRLMDYFNENKTLIEKNILLVYSFSEVMNNLCQSKAYDILYNLYLLDYGLIIKKEIIDSLICSGGHKCLKILKNILNIEHNQLLKKYILQNIRQIKITDI